MGLARVGIGARARWGGIPSSAVPGRIDAIAVFVATRHGGGETASAAAYDAGKRRWRSADRSDPEERYPVPTFFTDNTVYENEKYACFAWENKSICDSQFYKCTFDKVSFQYTELKNCSFEDCLFNNCNCSLIKLRNVRFTGTQFIRSKLLGINWSAVNKLFTVKFTQSNLNSSVFSDMNLTKFIFDECSLEDAVFSRVSLAGAVFQNCCLKNCAFSDADLSNADFSTSYEYFISSERNKFRKTIFSLPEAVRLLKNFDIVLQ